MGKTLDLGRRIELQPIDKHCHNISLGLYLRQVDGVSQVSVHTYASVPGADERLAFLTEALAVMAGLEPVLEQPGWSRFPCGTMHLRALRRGFLDLCKLSSDAPLAPKPMTVFDKKAGCDLTAMGVGDGVYEIRSEADDEAARRRCAAVARGFAKLCEMDAVEGSENRVRFPCGADHDALIGLLLFRAQNVRASLQEQELAAARGILAAPSQQQS
jgi:hypothetical protein